MARVIPSRPSIAFPFPTVAGAGDVASGSASNLGDVIAYSANFMNGRSGMTTLDISQGTVPEFTTGDGDVVGNSAYGYSGRYGVRCFPPQASGEYSALGQLQVCNQAFTHGYMSWQVQVGSAWSANNDFDAVKHLIMQFGPDPTRPMVYIDCRPSFLGIAPSNSAFTCPAQGTTRYFSESHPGNNFWDGDGRADFYWGQSNTTYAGKTVISPSTWVCMELLFDSRSPTGLIRLRQSLADGTILSDLDASMGWQYEAGVDQDVDFHTIDVLGGYYNGGSTASSADNYIAIDRYIRFQKGKTTFDGWPVP